MKSSDDRPRDAVYYGVSNLLGKVAESTGQTMVAAAGARLHDAIWRAIDDYRRPEPGEALKPGDFVPADIKFVCENLPGDARFVHTSRPRVASESPINPSDFDWDATREPGDFRLGAFGIQDSRADRAAKYPDPVATMVKAAGESFGVIQEGRHKGRAFKVAWADPPSDPEGDARIREALHGFGYDSDDQPSDSALADLIEARLSGDPVRELTVRIVNGFTVVIDDSLPAGVIVFRSRKS